MKLITAACFVALIGMAAAASSDLYPLVIPGNTSCPISYQKFPVEAFVANSKTTSMLTALINEGVKQKFVNSTCYQLAVAHLPQCLNDLSLQDGCCDENCANGLLLADESQCSKQYLETFCNIANGAYFQVPFFNTWMQCTGQFNLNCEPYKLKSPPTAAKPTTTSTPGTSTVSAVTAEEPAAADMRSSNQTSATPMAGSLAVRISAAAGINITAWVLLSAGLFAFVASML